ncbi:MAG: alpha/beta hydrolase [Akkermansiaceae bacterium]
MHKPYHQVDGMRVSETSRAVMRVFPATAKRTGQAIVIFPGGGYSILAHKHEGSDVARYFAAKGITCFVAYYRVTKGKHPGYRFPGPLLDARQAIRLAKGMAKKYKFDAAQLGVMGYSAGGHLAAMCATRFEDTFPQEPASETSVRPAFAALIYPVASMVHPRSHGGSRYKLFGNTPKKIDLEEASPELRVKKGYPPVFITHTQFDPVSSQLSLNIAAAYTKVKVPCELHFYPVGGHGYGMRGLGDEKAEKKNPALRWPVLLENFLTRLR